MKSHINMLLEKKKSSMVDHNDEKEVRIFKTEQIFYRGNMLLRADWGAKTLHLNTAFGRIFRYLIVFIAKLSYYV